MRLRLSRTRAPLLALAAALAPLVLLAACDGDDDEDEPTPNTAASPTAEQAEDGGPSATGSDESFVENLCSAEAALYSTLVDIVEEVQGGADPETVRGPLAQAAGDFAGDFEANAPPADLADWHRQSSGEVNNTVALFQDPAFDMTLGGYLVLLPAAIPEIPEAAYDRLLETAAGVPLCASSAIFGQGPSLDPNALTSVATKRPAVEVPDASLPRDGTTLGSPDAPVRVIEYVDFQCPNCERFAREVFPALREEYISFGEVHWEIRSFAFIGQESLDAANAAFCAADQNLFWEYDKLLWDNRRGENVGSFTLDNLKAFALEVPAMDLERFGQCVDSGQFADRVEEQREEARAAGLTGTPGFVVEGPGTPEPISFSGSPSVDEWTGLIEEIIRQP